MFDTHVVSATYLSPYQLSCVSPAHVMGTVRLSISMDGMEWWTASGDSGLYHYVNMPTIGYITPNSGSVMGMNTMTVYGTNFRNTTTYYCQWHNQTQSIPAIYINDTTLTCQVLPYTGTMVNVSSPLTVLFDVCTSSVPSVQECIGQGFSTQQYTYYAAYNVTSINPNTGDAQGHTLLNVSGVNFPLVNTSCVFRTIDPMTGISMGMVSYVSAIYVSNSYVLCYTPASSSNLTLQVGITQNGVDIMYSSTSSTWFTYVDAIMVHSIQPWQGTLTGGTLVTILGQHFRNTSTLQCMFDTLKVIGTDMCHTPTYHGSGHRDSQQQWI
jgi:hypothetical protein